MSVVLEREEYIEQSYFFRTFRERLADNLAAQDILARMHEEILTTTRLPMAVQFLTTELKHSGVLHTGMERLGHYFTGFQTFVIGQAEQEGLRFTMATALLILEREAAYKAESPTRSGLFVYQFEAICRNRLGYQTGLTAMAKDPMYDADWRAYLDTVRKQVGIVDFADLVFVRSEAYLHEQRRANPQYQPSSPPLLGEKEGKIAPPAGDATRSISSRLCNGNSAIRKYLVRRRVTKNRTGLTRCKSKMREMEARLKLLEAEVRGNVDLSQFGKPELLDDDE